MTVLRRRGRISVNATRNTPYAAKTPNAIDPIEHAMNIKKFTKSAIPL
jgi:hypothetical protein